MISACLPVQKSERRGPLKRGRSRLISLGAKVRAKAAATAAAATGIQALSATPAGPPKPTPPAPPPPDPPKRTGSLDALLNDELAKKDAGKAEKQKEKGKPKAPPDVQVVVVRQSLV